MPEPKRYPDFFIVGAQRAGTTSLYEYLRQHPQIFMSAHKETHYFSQDRTRLDSDLQIHTREAYWKLFAPAPASAVCGEASPSYLWHPDVARRIHTQQPQAKIIAILRDPIRRAFSHYQMDLADGMSPVPFHELIEQEYLAGDKVYGTGHLYVDLGLYASQLRTYLDIFGADRVLVLAFDDLKSDAAGVMGRIAAFLQVDPAPFQRVDTSVVHNRTIMPRTAPARRFMQYRSARMLYRVLVPGRWRRSVRDHFFVLQPPPALDPRAIEFMYSIYAPELAELGKICTVTFPEFDSLYTV